MSEGKEKSLSAEMNDGLYQRQHKSFGAAELGFGVTHKGNEFIKNIREEILAEEAAYNLLHTNVEKEEVTGVLATGADGFDADEIATVVEDNAEGIVTFVTEGAEDVEEAVSEGAAGTLSTAIQKAGDVASEGAEKATGLMTKVSKVVGVTTKVGKVGSKVGKVSTRFVHDYVPVADKNGNINSSEYTKRVAKTVAKRTGRQFVGKPAQKYVNKQLRKGGNKVAAQATKKIAAKEAKLTGKAVKIGSKATTKAAKVGGTVVRRVSIATIKVVAAMLKAIAAFLGTMMTAGAAILVLVIVIVLCLSVFGAVMEKKDLDKYNEWITETHTAFQEKTLGYFNEGYRVDGTYDGFASIDWRAALATLQALDPELNGEEDALKLLKSMKKTGTMYKIEEKTTSEYVYKTETKTVTNDDGTTTTEVIEHKTTKMYVVTIGTLDDYKLWVKNNPNVIKKYYKKRGISYDKNTTNFLTDELSEAIDNLYNSEIFDMLLKENNISLTPPNIENLNPGEDTPVYDTSDSTGTLAYPTKYRRISAGFPTYPSGRRHTGIDFPCPTGTPVLAAADGKVVVVKRLNYSYGHHVIIQHSINGKTLYTAYAHNSSIKVTQGQTVKRGQLIALSGSTGNSTGPHCHFEVRVGRNSSNATVQPKDYL